MNQLFLGTATLCLLPALVEVADAHGEEPWVGVQPLAWTNRVIGRAFAVPFPNVAREVSIDGQACIAGSSFGFDVRDGEMFDMDERVRVDVKFYNPPIGTEVVLNYDRSDRNPFGTSSVRFSGKSSRFVRRTFVLNHARFANLGFNGSDLTIDVPYNGGSSNPDITVSIKRSHTTSIDPRQGQVAIVILDEFCRPTPARREFTTRPVVYLCQAPMP